MWNRLKPFLASDKAVALVNGAFFLSILLPGRGITVVFYSLWILFLLFRMGAASARGERILYGVILLFAAAMLAVNVRFALQ